MKLKNKIALITGASTGIGRATAIALAQEGCSVVINYKTNAQPAKIVLQECNKYSIGNMIIKTDITKRVAVKKMIEKIEKTHKHLHILINNAGIFDEHDSPTNDEVFELLFKQNFLSHILVTKHALPIMHQGKIINVSSIHGKLDYGRPTATAYSAFKAALESYTKKLAKQCAPKILVNAIAPGRVVTPMWGNLTTSQQKKLGKVHLINRMIEPEEIADGILFLIKNDAMCGEILRLDGGYQPTDTN